MSEGRHVVALLNRSPSPEIMTASFADDIGLAPGSQWTAIDVWTKADYSSSMTSKAVRHRKNISRKVAAHSVEIMVLSQQ